MAAKAAARKAIPPTTPPAIAAALEWLFLVEEGELVATGSDVDEELSVVVDGAPRMNWGTQPVFVPFWTKNEEEVA